MIIDEKLSNIFDIETIEKPKVQMTPVTATKAEDDFDQTRLNLYSLMQSGQDALICALEIAKSSEHPRAFEVVGNLMKQLADINEQILKLHERKQKLEAPIKSNETVSNNQVTNNNAIFVGSTFELDKLLHNINTGV